MDNLGFQGVKSIVNASVMRMDLVFRDVSVSIGDSSILKNVSGVARSGEMLAVIGPNGAGKTTLLNAIAGRHSIDSGEVTLNGCPVTRGKRRQICYVVQSDVFLEKLTLKETLTFTAYLRLPDTMSKDLKLQRVDEIITSLDLTKCQNTVIGGPSATGLSGGEKKRASIACELLTNPAMLLLDEPTSGLDSAIAFNLMSTLKRYTQVSQKTVVATIHQPSSQMFYLFDNILLLTNGEMGYFGKTSEIVDYLSSAGLQCDIHYNPADFILEKVTEGGDVQRTLVEATSGLRQKASWPAELRTPDVKSKTVPLDTEVEPNSQIGARRQKSPQAVVSLSVAKLGENAVCDDVRIDLVPRETKNDLDIDQFYAEGAKWQTSFWTQYSTLTQRSFIQGRSRILARRIIFQTLITSVICGVYWLNSPRVELTINDRRGLIFFTSVYLLIQSVLDMITSVPDERHVMTKERSSGIYRLSSYFLAKMTTDCPLILVLTTVNCTIVYWMANLTREADSFFYYLLILYLHVLTAQSLGLLISVAVADFRTATLMASITCFTMTLSAGYLNQHLPSFMQWLGYISPVNYAFGALQKVEFLYGPPLQCNPIQTTAFPECTSQNETITGESVLAATQVTGPLWLDVVVLFVFILVFRAVAYLVLRFLRRPTHFN